MGGQSDAKQLSMAAMKGDVEVLDRMIATRCYVDHPTQV